MASMSALTLRTAHAKSEAFAAADSIAQMLGIVRDDKKWGAPPAIARGGANQRCEHHLRAWLWEDISSFLKNVEQKVKEFQAVQAAPLTKPTSKPNKAKAGTVQN
ncbi:MAG: hypothetical protein M3X11_17260 [Acidobacteriota bacterium]|nr:hypothetical protein [Acidobacteriota bacterium]